MAQRHRGIPITFQSLAILHRDMAPANLIIRPAHRRIGDSHLIGIFGHRGQIANELKGCNPQMSPHLHLGILLLLMFQLE